MKDKDLRDFARGFIRGILNGDPDDMMCWMVSAPLAGYLNYLGIKCEVVEGEVSGKHHCWVKLEDGRIIDGTAKQFGRKPIYLKPAPDDYVIGDYRPSIKRSSKGLEIKCHIFPHGAH